MIILYNFSHPPMSTQFYRLKTVGTGVNIPCQYLPLANYCNLFIYDLCITTIPTFFEPVLDSSKYIKAVTILPLTFIFDNFFGLIKAIRNKHCFFLFI